jgi:phospholipase A1/A2
MKRETGTARWGERRARFGRRCRRAGLVLLLLVLPAGTIAAAEGIESGLARCSGIADADARLACFDALAARGRALEAMPAPPPSQEMMAAAAPEPETRAGRPPRELLGVRPYRRNYLLPVAYNANPNRNVPQEEVIQLPVLGDALDNVEMKFQLSFEVPVWTRILDQDLDLYFAYTQLAFFQAYNEEYSSPFRETNYEPELGLNWEPDATALGWRLTSTRLALNHQSNGRSDPLSRSWNRLIGQVEAESGNLSLALRLWTLLEDDPSNNEDITEYLGYGEIHAGYDLGDHHLGLMLRNPRRPTVQLDWSYPLGRTVRLYVQYFNGYGESLLDYDHSVNRIGAGFLLNDWP